MRGNGYIWRKEDLTGKAGSLIFITRNLIIIT